MTILLPHTRENLPQEAEPPLQTKRFAVSSQAPSGLIFAQSGRVIGPPSTRCPLTHTRRLLPGSQLQRRPTVRHVSKGGRRT
jgi:hypothetical protein